MYVLTHTTYLNYQNHKIYVKRKHLNANAPAILYIHGLKYSTDAIWDLPVDGQSAMDILALSGFDVWAFDFIGLGKSDKPVKFDGTIEFVTETIKTVINYIKIHNQNELNLVAWSAGCTWALCLAQNININKMVLISPRVPKNNQQSRLTSDNYRCIQKNYVVKNWLGAFSAEKRNLIVNNQTIDLFIDSLNAEDITADSFSVPSYLQNLMELYISKEVNFYNLSKINTPIGIICGELDVSPNDSKLLFDEIKTLKKIHFVKNATHWLSIEKARLELFDFCKDFLK